MFLSIISHSRLKDQLLIIKLATHPLDIFLASASCFVLNVLNAWKQLSRNIHKDTLFSLLNLLLASILCCQDVPTLCCTYLHHVEHLIVLLCSPLWTHMLFHDIDSVCLEQKFYFSTVFQQWNPAMWLHMLCIHIIKQNYYDYQNQCLGLIFRKILSRKFRAVLKRLPSIKSINDQRLYLRSLYFWPWDYQGDGVRKKVSELYIIKTQEQSWSHSLFANMYCRERTQLWFPHRSSICQNLVLQGLIKGKSDAATISAKKRLIDLMYSSAPKANAFHRAKVLFEIGMGWISDGCLCLQSFQPTHDLSRLKTLVGLLPSLVRYINTVTSRGMRYL